MSNIPRIRRSFSADVADLSRLRQAIDIDVTRPREWRDSVLGEIDTVIRSLMSAPAQSFK